MNVSCLNEFQALSRRLRGQVLSSCVLALFAGLSIALTAIAGPSELQLYSDRPDIFEVKAQAHNGHDVDVVNWNTVQTGYFAFLAQTLAFFPGDEIYFLARDTEYGYDLIKILYKGNDDELKRFHLVPISTEVSKHALLEKYLAQEGVRPGVLKGRHAVFVDSCCAGSIPEQIRLKMEKKGVKVRGFLMLSSVFPNSSLFSQYGATGMSVESQSHYTNSATNIVLINKNGKPRYEVEASSSISHVQLRAIKIRESLRARFDNDESRARFVDLLKNMRMVVDYVTGRSEISKFAAIQASENLKKRHKISLSAFLDDVDSLKRRDYAEISSERRQHLQWPDSGVYHDKPRGFVLDNAIPPTAKPGEIDEGVIGEIATKMLEIFAENSSKDLNISEPKYTAIARVWLGYVSNSMDDQLITAKLISNFLTVNQKLPQRSRPVLRIVSRDLADLFDDVVLESVAYQGVAEALASEGFAVKSGSMGHRVLESFLQVKNSLHKTQKVVDQIVREAAEEDYELLLVMLLENIKEVEFGPYLAKLSRLLIKGMPKISKKIVEAFLGSNGLMACLENSCIDVKRWFVIQVDNFESSAKNLELKAAKGFSSYRKTYIAEVLGDDANPNEVKTMGDLARLYLTKKNRKCKSHLKASEV